MVLCPWAINGCGGAGRSEPDFSLLLVDGANVVCVNRNGPDSIEVGESARSVAADRLGRTAVRVEDRHVRLERNHPSDIGQRGLGILLAQIQTRTRR